MRARDVRAKIAESLEAIVPDTIASASDKFVHASAIHDIVLRDRTFVIERAAPQEPSTALLATIGSSPDPYIIRFVVQVFYVLGDSTQDRMLDDGDLVLDALRGLANEPQIRTIEISGSSDIDDANSVVAVWDVAVTYDRRQA